MAGGIRWKAFAASPFPKAGQRGSALAHDSGRGPQLCESVFEAAESPWHPGLLSGQRSGNLQTVFRLRFVACHCP